MGDWQRLATGPVNSNPTRAVVVVYLRSIRKTRLERIRAQIGRWFRA